MHRWLEAASLGPLAAFGRARLNLARHFVGVRFSQKTVRILRPGMRVTQSDMIGLMASAARGVWFRLSHLIEMLEDVNWNVVGFCVLGTKCSGPIPFMFSVVRTVGSVLAQKLSSFTIYSPIITNEIECFDVS